VIERATIREMQFVPEVGACQQGGDFNDSWLREAKKEIQGMHMKE
jgi:hypothetical protein